MNGGDLGSTAIKCGVKRARAGRFQFAKLPSWESLILINPVISFPLLP